ncbi:MAG TPA: aminoacetone oxidase family FAD-binding enzyme [Lachnospiraceae bacterium]|nr:aminoacetone oxidase family FAD-binding enzyme [Lachnospiraceae bacterium]
MEKTDILVTGGGPAGMMAAIMSARSGKRVCLIEKNEKLGKKLFITGKGRCNFTNACDTETLLDNVITNKKFLYGAFYGFDSEAVRSFFDELGLKHKTERGNRVFPVSDHSSDVIRALEKELDRLSVRVMLNKKVMKLILEDGRVLGVKLSDGSEIRSDAVILCTGGRSYSLTGSDGDGERLLRDTGIRMEKMEPSLVPLVVSEPYIGELQGLSLKNVSLMLFTADVKKYEGFGELLFTHFGLSGPLALSGSCHIKEADYAQGVRAVIDLKPALSEKQLDDRLLRDFSVNTNKRFKNSLGGLLPAKLIPTVVRLSGIDPEKEVNSVTKDERKGLLKTLKALTFTVTGNRGFDEAVITRGGVSVKEIDPSTMRVKKIKGLYLAGEMIDTDAYTGGFNLQIAWSTGALAGSSAAEGMFGGPVQ